jgi:cytochrome c oxidase subunit II
MMAPDADGGLNETMPPGPPAGAAIPPQKWWRGPVGHVVLIWLGLTVIGVLFALLVPGRIIGTPASDSMHSIRLTVIVLTVTAAPVAAVVWGVAAYSLVAWRHRSSEPPTEDGPPIRANTAVSFTWLLVSSALTLFLLVIGLAELQAITAKGSDPLVVNVVGQQWTWTYAYPGNGNVQATTLVLPLGQRVDFRVTSNDVVHSFWIPQMGVKIDANPGAVTTTGVTPTRLGQFTVRCAELCGLYHAYMQSEVRVVSPGAFDSWVRSGGRQPLG